MSKRNREGGINMKKEVKILIGLVGVTATVVAGLAVYRKRNELKVNDTEGGEMVDDTTMKEHHTITKDSKLEGSKVRYLKTLDKYGLREFVMKVNKEAKDRLEARMKYYKDLKPVDRIAYKYGDYYFMVKVKYDDKDEDEVLYEFSILVFDYAHVLYREFDGGELEWTHTDGNIYDVMKELVDGHFSRFSQELPEKVVLDYDTLAEIFEKDEEWQDAKYYDYVQNKMVSAQTCGAIEEFFNVRPLKIS